MYSAADLAMDLTCFFVVAGRWPNRAAPVTLRFLMYPCRLSLNLSPSHPQILFARLGGVDEPVPKPQAADNSSELDVQVNVTISELRDAPETLAARLVAFALRHFHAARVDEERVVGSIQPLLRTLAAARSK